MTYKTLLYGSDALSIRQEKWRKFAMYFICGVATVLVNTASFIIFDKLVSAEAYVNILGWQFDLMLFLNQGIAWFLSLVTAFFGNRAFVFVSHGNIFKEFISFMAVRFASFIFIELILFALFVMWCENAIALDSNHVLGTIGSFTITVLYILKMINSLVLIAINYYASKGIVFKEGKCKGNSK